MDQNTRVVYLAHGGGPMPLLGDPSHDDIVNNMKLVASKIGKPSVILVISAHWEAKKPTLTAGIHPELIYDYYGFPPESYSIKYPAPGDPALATKIAGVLKSKGVDAQLDDQRGYDHGVFVPLKIMYPQADIPCIQLSLVNGLSPEEHLALGEAIGSLDIPGLLVVGSGFSFHNLRAIFSPNTPDSRKLNESFEAWLKETCTDTQIDYAARRKRLIEWQKAPGALFCHPREEHLIPLHVCCGVLRTPAKESFSVDLLGKKASVYLW